MPYKIIKVPGGYVAEDNKGMRLSKHAMTKHQVQKQIIAVHLSKIRKSGKSDVFKK